MTNFHKFFVDSFKFPKLHSIDFLKFVKVV